MGRGKVLLLWLLLAFGLPLLGALLAGTPVPLRLPRPLSAPPPSFSWPIFLSVSLLELGLFGRLLLGLRRLRWRLPERFCWPKWGFLALSSLGLSWLLSWSELGEGIAPLRFPLLWWSYVATICALTQALGGRSYKPGELLWLALLSAPFWWLFEFYNLFVQNWFYLGVERFSELEYLLFATLAFTTVLPAVSATYRLLSCLAAPVPFPATPLPAWPFLLLAPLSLLLLPLFPRELFPLVWIAPFLLLFALQEWFSGEGLLKEIGQGHLELVLLGALAGLVCGLFWEMWNFWSFPKWRYAIPLLHRFPLFEMPLLGYGGYLPFGIGCVALSEWWLTFLPCRRGPRG